MNNVLSSSETSQRNISLPYLTNPIFHKTKRKENNQKEFPSLNLINNKPTKYYSLRIPLLFEKLRFLTMMFTMTKSVLLSALLASTSLVFADETPMIVGGDEAQVGDYPYFGE